MCACSDQLLNRAPAAPGFHQPRDPVPRASLIKLETAAGLDSAQGGCLDDLEYVDRTRYEQVVKEFFTCDPEALSPAFSASSSRRCGLRIAAAHGAHGAELRDGTGQPRDPRVPGNLKDARDAVFPFFWGTDSWSSPCTWKTSRARPTTRPCRRPCLFVQEPEPLHRHLQPTFERTGDQGRHGPREFAFYHTEDPWGVSSRWAAPSRIWTARRSGSKRSCPAPCSTACTESSSPASCPRRRITAIGASQDGLASAQSSCTQSHRRRMAMRLDLLAEKLEDAACQRSARRVRHGDLRHHGCLGQWTMSAASAASWMSSPGDTACRAPQLHVDAAVGWVLEFLTEYDTARNPLGFSPELLAHGAARAKLTRRTARADSITIDFHKMGWGHYPGSAFLVNRRADLRYLARTVAETPYFSEAEGAAIRRCSRWNARGPALGPYTVMASLNGIGLTGWQLLVARALELAERARSCAWTGSTTAKCSTWTPRARASVVGVAQRPRCQGDLHSECRRES